MRLLRVGGPVCNADAHLRALCLSDDVLNRMRGACVLSTSGGGAIGSVVLRLLSPLGELPLRITRTLGRANCAAVHMDETEGETEPEADLEPQ